MLARVAILRGFFALLLTAPSQVAAIDFASLQAQISTHSITTVEGLIQSLPEPLRANYTLIFHSRSLQEASYAHPRAILFGNDATLVISFNGDASQRGYDAVETMEFDAPSSGFRFREIRFAEPGLPPTVSESNPARCTACHGTPARPIWDTSPSWPGVYGERYHFALSAQETSGMRQYLALQPVHARYRALLGSLRFAQRDTYVNSATAIYNSLTSEPPNAQLSMLLTQLNTRAIMARLSARPGYDAHRYVLLAAAESDCGPLEQFYPAALQSSLGIALQEYLRSHEQVDRQQEAAKAARLSDASAVRWRAGQVLDMGQLRFVAERGLGLNTDLWTLALERNTYDLKAPPGTVSVGEALLQTLSSMDGTLAQLHAYRSFGSDDTYCKQLGKRSRQALEAWYATGAKPDTDLRATIVGTARQEAITNGAALVARCVACHTGEIAPLIPFGDPEAMAARLTTGDYPRGRLLDEILYRLSDGAGADRMPRGALMASDQVRALETYFVGLANASGL